MLLIWTVLFLNPFRRKNMKQVSKEEFWNYFQEKGYTKRQGDSFHSDNFIVDGEIVGCMMTSSYGVSTVYQLKYGTVNTEALWLVGNIIKQKLK